MPPQGENTGSGTAGGVTNNDPQLQTSLEYGNPMKGALPDVENAKQGAGESGGEPHKLSCLEKVFQYIGRKVAYNPWTTMIVSFFLCFVCASGWAVLKTESRPERLWVPTGAAAIEQKDYVEATWPSAARFNFWIAKCKTDDCNVMEPKYIQELQKLNQKILDIVVDGDLLRTNKVYAGVKDDWEKFGYTGKFSFEKNYTDPSIQEKCFKFGPFCGSRSYLDIFNDDKTIINSLTTAQAALATNTWETQTISCPVTIAREDSPCIAPQKWLATAESSDCQNYKTSTERQNCRQATRLYCDDVCPTSCVPPGSPTCTTVPTGTCGDSGCMTVAGMESLAARGGNGTAPASAFQFEPFKIASIISSGNGPEKNAAGLFISAEAAFGYYVLNEDTSLIGDDEEDPISEAWELEALCILGVQGLRELGTNKPKTCDKNELFEISANFRRSLGDEFGNAIRADVAALGTSYILILVYMILMLSPRDSVHSMIGMGLVTVIIVGLSFAGSKGLGAYFGLPDNPLNNNIPFLLLGLGVDDAFVLSSEFTRACRANPRNSIEENVVISARNGGVSILITSATDALAFLVGSATLLPALSNFCVFAGIGVILCFILQITVFLPSLAINAYRAKANRYDLFCCCKASKPHPFEEEQGCCLCCKCKSGKLPKALAKTGTFVTSKVGGTFTALVFAGVLAAGIIGSTRIYKDFKLEWFFPGDSYVNTFFDWNQKYFETGKPVTIYTRNIDYFANQEKMRSMHAYLVSSKFVDQNEGINDWHHEFLEAVSQNTSVWKRNIGSDGMFMSDKRKEYYRAIHDWMSNGGGVRYRSQVQWTDTRCSNATNAACDATKGVSSSRIGATLKLEYTDLGQMRYNTMVDMRADVAAIISDAFPYSFEFLYWEEVGIIDVELVRNLIICGVVIAVMVSMMIPHPRIAVWVAITIFLSVIDLVGFMYWWGVTISGVSTIYILISVGLAVDYSAHIAHVFVESYGTSRQRAVAALERIGPSVFNAIVSTLLAVLVIGFSRSYVFQVFFKALFLTVLIGGAHGMLFLPMVLSLFGGGRNHPKSDSPRPVKSTQVTSEVEMSTVTF